VFRVSLALVAIGASAFGAQRDGAVEGLTATAEIAGQQYCLGMSADGIAYSKGEELAPDAITIRLGLRVLYRNAGAGSIILPDEDNVHYVLSRSLEDIANLRHQVVIPYYSYEPRRTWRLRDWLDPECCESPELINFKVLTPGATWTEDNAAYGGIQVHKPSPAGTGKELLGRKIFFQLQIDHAMIPKSVERNLQTKWHAYGTLWTGTIRTQPIELNIPNSPDGRECEPLRGL
jgi:hypothetical protein